jgi:hypothetical protein
MSDKNLLAESTIRRFMKLARTEALSDNFIAEAVNEDEDQDTVEEGEGKKKYGRKEMEAAAKKAREHAKKTGDKRNTAGAGVASMLREEEDDEESLDEEIDLEEQEEELEDPDPMGDAEDPEDMGDMGEMDPAPEEPEMGAADMSLSEEEAQLLIDLGERLSAAMAGAEGEEDDDMEMDMDMGDMEGEDDAPEMEEEDPAYRMDEDTQDDLVNEVLRRVTKRLVAEKLKNRK